MLKQALNIGIGLFAGVIAFVLSVITFGIGWRYYRPIIGFSLLGMGVGVFVLYYFGAYLRKPKKSF